MIEFDLPEHWPQEKKEEFTRKLADKMEKALEPFVKQKSNLSESDLRYLDGFNDALLMIILADYHKSWKEAVNRFDNEKFFSVEPVKSNLKKVKEIMELKK